MPHPAPPHADTFTLGEPGGLELQISTLGARWLSCRVPLRNGEVRETVLGHARPDDHAVEPGFFGAVVGRYANRLGRSRFTLDGITHALQPNEGANQLHGGPDGFDLRVWTVRSLGTWHAQLVLHSPAGDQGYPGALEAQVTVRLDPEGCCVHVQFHAQCSAPCPVNLTYHPYFNLDGTAEPVLNHTLQVAAQQMLPVAPDMIPTGEVAPVAGTAFDLTTPHRVGERLGDGPQQQLGHGYDHCFVLDDTAARGEAAAATLTASDGQLALQLFTNYPGLQVCSGNFVHQARGRDGQPFARHAGIALEPQFFPDAPNHPIWQHQGCIVRPGQPLSRWMRLQFLPA